MRFQDVDLLATSEPRMLGTRGRRMSKILQDPKFSLNPIRKIGDQVAQAWLAHNRAPHRDAKARALDVTARMQVLSILDTLVRDRGIGPIVISHDLNLVCNFCDRVLMPSAGRVVESLQTSDLDRA